MRHPDESKHKRKYEKGNWVRYMPEHVEGNMHHDDCEDGVVSSVSECSSIIFVKYDNELCIMTTGDEPYAAQATAYDDLKFMGKRRL